MLGIKNVAVILLATRIRRKDEDKFKRKTRV